MKIGPDNLDNIHANILLSQAPSNQKSKIKINKHRNILQGSKYAMIRPQFENKKVKIKKNIENIFICFGGGDDKNMIQKTVKYLSSFERESLKLHIVSGIQNPNNRKLINFFKRVDNKKIFFYINPMKIALIMSKCDLAIVSGGTILAEVASIGLPPLVIPFAKNQIDHSIMWQKTTKIKSLGIYKKINKKNFLNNLFILDKSYSLRKKISLNISNEVDTHGAKRVARFVEKFYALN
jgi:spore coat polysaccharide biosynthesis predicted glycosyltransferase SpsG